MKNSDLTNMLQSLKETFQSMGYTKANNVFWRVHNGMFELIDFQSGAHGNYFFINVCLHPVGFPEILSNRLVIPEKPREHECIIRQRIEQIGDSQSLDSFRKTLVSPTDVSIIEAIKDALMTDVKPWISRWGTFQSIARADKDELKKFVNAVPTLKERARAMLQYFCLTQIGEFDNARQALAEIKAMPTGKWRFEQVDDYLASLLKG